MWLFFLFLGALFAWMDGDDSGKWIVIIGVAFLLLAQLAGSCS